MKTGLSTRLAWQRKMLRQGLASALDPNADDLLIQVQRKLALDARRHPAKSGTGPRVFAQYMTAAQFAASLPGPARVLELGRGYSTVALSWSLPPDALLVSVDAKPVSAYDIHTPLARLAERVRFEDGFTITGEQMGRAYEPRALTDLLGPGDALRRALPDFLVPAQSPYAGALGLNGMDAEALARACLERMFQGGEVLGPDRLLPEMYARDSRFVAPGPPSVLDRLMEEFESFDAVFFDCGEFSSLPEWSLLSDRIRPGGLAVFHDVYFPKSVKNYLICAAVAASADWEILYRDRSTPQGLVVARRRG